MDAFRRLTGKLPAPAPVGDHGRLTGKLVREACAGVPLANPGQAAIELERILDGLLAARWQSGERLAAVGYLQPAIAGLCQGIERELASEPHPLAPAAAARAATAQRLHDKLSLAATAGVADLCGPVGKLPRLRGRVVAGGLLAALIHAEQVLLWAYRQYDTPPAGLWGRIHALYAFAAEAGLADRVAADPGFGRESSPRGVYLRILLLATSNPYRYSARELPEAWRVVDCIAGRCGLARADAQGIGVDIESDAGPGYAIGEQRDGGAPGMLALDPVPGVEWLQGRLAGCAPGAAVLDLPQPAGGSVPVALVQRVCDGWNHTERRHRRLAAGHVLDLVFGMHALHYALAGNLEFAAFVRKVHGDAIMVGRHELASAWLAAGDATRPRSFRGEVLDQSHGGYRLCVGGADGVRLRIGEVLGLAPASEEPEDRDWMVGVIRWLRRDGDREMLGVELLRREARAAGMRPVTDAGETLEPRRAVELPGGGEPGQLSLLLTDQLARNVVAAEVALPSLASEWDARATVATWRRQAVEAVGPACFRVTLVRDASGVEA